MAKTISLETGSCSSYEGTTAVSGDTVYLWSDGYNVKVKITVPQRIKSLSGTVAFRGNNGTAQGKAPFKVGVTQTNGSSPPSGLDTFYFDSDSNRKGSFSFSKKMKAGTWYLWVWKSYDAGNADRLYGSKSDGYPVWDLSGVTDPAGHVYRDGAWKDAVPKVYRGGEWKDAAAKEYNGAWEDLG